MRKKRKIFSIKTLLFLVYVIVVGFILYFNKYGYKTYLRLEQQQKKLKSINTELIEKKNTLKRELELQDASSPFFIEMIARQRLRMAKKGEYIYFISDNEYAKKREK